MIGKPPLKYILAWIPSEDQVPELMNSLSWSGAEIVEKWIPSVGRVKARWIPSVGQVPFTDEGCPKSEETGGVKPIKLAEKST